jgi:hypothetical protein
MTNYNSSSSVDLAKLFGSVAQTMLENQSTLNQADTYNHDHGSNMVDIFNTITNAIQEQPNASAAAQLGNASKALAKNTTSGSAKLYSAGLKNAADQFKGTQSLNTNDAMQLIQLLLGSTNTLPQSTSASGSSGADLIGSLLNSYTGQQTPATTTTTGSDDSKIGLDDILTAGMAFLEAKQSGKTGLEAVMAALVSDSTVANQDYRAESAKLVANTLLSAVSKMAQARK